jgi:hypothetical protein
MSSSSPSLIYENHVIRCRVRKTIPRIETHGLELKELTTGQEFEVYFWVAEILVNAGYAEYSEEALSNNEWTQIHFKERLNPAAPPSQLIDDFYARAYISFKQREDVEEKKSSLNRMKARYRDVVESRISRITRLASAESLSSIRALQPEESRLYDALRGTIAKWRSETTDLGE